MNSNERLDCNFYERPQDYREDPRGGWGHPLSASTLILTAPMEWPALALAWGEVPASSADVPRQY